MTNDWTTYEFLNRQAALSPVRRQPQPPSPHHGVSASQLLSVPNIKQGRRVPLSTASTQQHITLKQSKTSPRLRSPPKPQRISVPVSAGTTHSFPKPSRLEPLKLDFLERADEGKVKQQNSEFENLPTGRRFKPRRKLGPVFHSDDPAHLQYYQSGGYDDYHKTYLKMQQNGLSPRFPHHGPPALRAGGGGGSWRHVRQVLQAGGNRRLFVDGQTRIQDNNKILYDEIPGVNVIQPVAQDTMRKLKPKSWTGADLRAFKAAEGQNYMIMR